MEFPDTHPIVRPECPFPMFRFVPLLLFSLAVCSPAAAQYLDDEYYPFAEREERRELLATDSTLFYRAIQSSADLYGELTDFNLPQVATKRRGLGWDAERISLSGLDLSYRHLSVLRLLGARETRHAGLVPAPGLPGGSGGVRLFDFPAGEPLQPFLASVRFTDRNYLVGAKAAASGDLGRGWTASLALDARTGRDLHVQGVFTNALTAALRVVHAWHSDHRLSLLCILPPSTRGTRLSSSEEAFSLTGDPLYNPAWGYQDGRVRNSRVRREFLPFLAARYERSLSAKTSLSLDLSAEAGLSRYSMLDWYDARTPMPDNYRYLPSYTGDLETERAWLASDPRYTQIDWDELIRRNRMRNGEAVYALDDRVERTTALCFHAAFTTMLDDALTLRYGLTLRYDRTRSYRQMRDLLGARYVTDIDRYLIDDDTYSNLLQNDLRHPDRKIREGDRFGYDYALLEREARILLQADYRSDRLRADFSAELGSAGISRRGYYEKELFPGALSFGASRTLRLAPWRLKALVGWSFSARSYLEGILFAAADTPSAEMLFYQPLYNNRMIESPRCERTFAAEFAWRHTGSRFDLRLAAYAAGIYDRQETRRYYDDLSALYCDMSVSGIGLLCCGIEVAAEIRLSYRWQLALAASAGDFSYIRDPEVTVLSDVDNTAVLTRATARMSGCHAGGAPQLAAVSEITYFGPRGWGFHLSAGYAGLRYVEPMPLRRTDRVTGQAGLTPEAFEAFTRQERLSDAFTLDASLFKSFYFDRSRLTVALILRNLSGASQTRYNGYESLRIRRISAGDTTLWMPHATRYTYAYPRSFYLTISYRF